MATDCYTYGLGVELTVLRKRLQTENLSPEEKKDIEKRIKEIETLLEV